MTTRPFPVDPVLTGIAIAYRNGALIADSVMPYTPPVPKSDFKYHRFPIGSFITIPKTRVGRKSEPNMVEFGAEETPASIEDFGLDDFIPNGDIEDAAGSGYDPKAHAVEGLTELVALDREVRVAGMVFDPATYPAENKTQLADTDQLSDYENSEALDVFNTALDTPIMRPNIAVFGQRAWTKVRGHPHLVKAVNGTAGDKGMVTREQFRELFELDEVLVGQGFVNIAKPGQNEVVARVWANHCALLHRTRVVSRQRGVTFGFTVPQGANQGKIAGSIPDQKKGLTGGEIVRSGQRVKELISAPDVGYFIEDIVSESDEE